MSAQHPHYVPQIEDPLGGSEVIVVNDETTLLVLNPTDTGVIDNVYVDLPEKADGGHVKVLVLTANIDQVTFLPPDGTSFLSPEVWAIGEGGYVAVLYLVELNAWVVIEVYNAVPV